MSKKVAERKKRIIFSNYYSEEDFQYAKESICEREDLPENEEPSEKDIWQEYYDILEADYENEKAVLETFFSKDFLIRGVVGRWDGNYDTGKIVHSFAELSQAWSECDYIELYDVDGHFYITVSHHDGDNFFEVKELTDRGREYASRHEYNMSDRELHEKLWIGSAYTRLPSYAHKMWGCPKRESA